MVASLTSTFFGINLLNDLVFSPVAGCSFGGSFSLYWDGCLIPLDWSSECHLHIGWLILEVALGVVGVTSIAVVMLIVSKSCIAGAIVGIVINIVLVSILVIGIIILTFVIWVSDISFIDLELITTGADINLVDLIPPSCINGLFCKDAGLKIHGFLESCL